MSHMLSQSVWFKNDTMESEFEFPDVWHLCSWRLLCEVKSFWGFFNSLILFQLMWWANFFLCWAPEFPSLCCYDKMPNQNQLKKSLFGWRQHKPVISTAKKRRKWIHACRLSVFGSLTALKRAASKPRECCTCSGWFTSSPLSAFRTVSHYPQCNLTDLTETLFPGDPRLYLVDNENCIIQSSVTEFLVVRYESSKLVPQETWSRFCLGRR